MKKTTGIEKTHSFKREIASRAAAAVLAVVTAASVLTVSAVPASAQTAVSSESIVKEIAKEGFKKIVGKATDGNFFTEILGSTAVSVFNSFLDEDEESDGTKVLNAVGEVSQKIDDYHREEIAAIENLGEEIEEMHDDINISSFNADYDRLTNDSYYAKHGLQWLESMGVGTDQLKYIDVNGTKIPMIDKNTYELYETVMTKKSIDEAAIASDLTAMYSDITGNSRQLKNNYPYNVMIDADCRICSHREFSYDQTVLTAANINDSRRCIDCIQADVMVDYAAYINLMKIDCLTEIYKKPDNAESVLDYYMHEKQFDTDYEGVIPLLYRQMEQLQESYDSADAYFESVVKATVDYTDPDTGFEQTAYYLSVPKAWAAAAATGRANISEAKMTIYDDVTRDENGVMGDLPRQCTWRYEKPKGNDVFGVYYLTSNNISFFECPYSAQSNNTFAYFSDHTDVKHLTIDVNGHTVKTSCGAGMLSTAVVVTNSCTNRRVSVIDSKGTSEINGHPYSDYQSFIGPLFQPLVENSSMTW